MNIQIWRFNHISLNVWLQSLVVRSIAKKMVWMLIELNALLVVALEQ